MTRSFPRFGFLKDRVEILAVVAAAVVALVGARPWAGSWNDGSRLAAVEAMVDHRTLAIDDSIYVRVPAGTTPYDSAMPMLNQEGTKDKLLVGEQFYSDKSMTLSVYLAAWYEVLQRTTGLEAAKSPALFAYWMTVLSSGVALVVAAWGMARLTRQVGGGEQLRLLLVGSLILGSAALPYSRHVQQHLPLLAVVVLLATVMVESEHRTRAGLLGLLAGLGYSLDLGAGPALVLCVGLWLVLTKRSLAATSRFVLGLLPVVLLHHAINFQIGGTLGPANANAEYLTWAGSPFSAASATGDWKHSPASLVAYGLELLFGTRGFVLHHLPLVLLPIVLVKRLPYRAELLTLLGWSVLTWLLYAAGSNNRSGACYSIRWFVPCLGAGYFALAVLLTHEPRWRRDFLPLGLASGVMAALGWSQGPWGLRMVPGYWVIVVAGLLGWGLIRSLPRRRSKDEREMEAAYRRAA